MFQNPKYERSLSLKFVFCQLPGTSLYRSMESLTAFDKICFDRGVGSPCSGVQAAHRTVAAGHAAGGHEGQERVHEFVGKQLLD